MKKILLLKQSLACSLLLGATHAFGGECETKQINGVPMRICPGMVIVDQKQQAAQLKPVSANAGLAHTYNQFATQPDAPIKLVPSQTNAGTTTPNQDADTKPVSGNKKKPAKSPQQ
jgi:hypothetical protein